MAHQEYIIDFSKCLGKGATADVYLGMKIIDGSKYALKCSRYQLKKEISILKDLDHKNIIRFYQSINSFHGYVQVIVMEYCNKGSLYDFIYIHRGLCDNMFLKTLECLYESIFYLRGKGYIHRDIKPGNMMVHLDCMGYYHVKLGDMGTAKRVNDDQTFMTLVGTEEYLHPDMYLRYLEGMSKEHNANVDLWSMGVTLYHAAVTQLPFLPFNYSRNSANSKNVLNTMYISKPKGAIAGKQPSNNSKDFQWSYTLPVESRMSPMLKTLAAKLLGNLMDITPENTYDRFFEESEKILKKRRVQLFNSSNGELQMLYLDSLSYADIMRQTTEIIGKSSTELILLTKNRRLEARFDERMSVVQSAPVKGHLHYILTDDTVLAVTTAKQEAGPEGTGNHLHVLNRDMTENMEAPNQRYNSLKEASRYSEDLQKCIFQIAMSANYIDCQIDCYKAVVNSFNENVMMAHLHDLNEALPWQLTTIQDTCMMTESLLNTTSACGSENRQNLLRFKEEIEQLRVKAKEGKACGEQYYAKIVEKREMSKFTQRTMSIADTTVDSLPAPGMEGTGSAPASLVGLGVSSVEDRLDLLVNLSEELVKEVKLVSFDKQNITDEYMLEIWQRHIQQFSYYQTAKDKLVQKTVRIKQLHSSYYKWLAQAQSITLRMAQLRDFLRRQEERRLSIRSKFIQVHEHLDRVIAGWGKPATDTINYNSDEEKIIRDKILLIQKLTAETKNQLGS